MADPTALREAVADRERVRRQSPNQTTPSADAAVIRAATAYVAALSAAPAAGGGEGAKCESCEDNPATLCFPCYLGEKERGNELAAELNEYRVRFGRLPPAPSEGGGRCCEYHGWGGAKSKPCRAGAWPPRKLPDPADREALVAFATSVREPAGLMIGAPPSEGVGPTFCPEDGPGVQVDEDGLCKQCGATATGDAVRRHFAYAVPATPPSEGRAACGEEDRRRGLYDKYLVERRDGSSKPGGKHADCHYFVLDRVHDKHAKAALLAYADSCRGEYPELAADLDAEYRRAPAGERGEP